MAKRSKFNTSKKSRWYKGTEYRSDFEVDIAKGLDVLKRRIDKKLKIKYESETIEYQLPSRLYVPDFIVEKADGTKVYIEAKGMFDRDAMLKMITVKEQNPDKRICLLFMKNNPVRRGAKMRYSDWAEKHGFEYSIGKIPEEWIK